MSVAIADLRRQVLAQRRSLADTESKTIGRAVCARCLDFIQNEWNKMRTPGVIALIRPLSDEWPLNDLVKGLRRLNIKICYPRAERGLPLEFFEVTDEEDPQFWVKGEFGVQEPSRHCRRIEWPEITAVLVPGAVFGESGARIGLGAGFYDQTLPRMPQALRFALAADFQVFKEVPQEPWDIRVDRIFTPTRQINCKKNREMENGERD